VDLARTLVLLSIVSVLGLGLTIVAGRADDWLPSLDSHRAPPA